MIKLHAVKTPISSNPSCYTAVNPEKLTTKSTFEGSFPGVRPCVSDHVAVVSESFAAVIAFEGLVPRVCPHVLLQRPGGAEFLRTQLAST